MFFWVKISELTKVLSLKANTFFLSSLTTNDLTASFEYLLLKGINDSEKHVKEIKHLLSDLNAYINLIPYNKVKEKDYETTDEENALRFYDLLKKNNVAVTLRQKKGDDIDAACGQLRANKIK